MNTLGIRVAPYRITIAVFDSEEVGVLNLEDIKIPRALSFPEALKYVRNSTLDVLREYSILKAGIRITESNARTANVRRISIEGVIQEAFASSTVLDYYCGQIANISARIGIDRSDFKLVVGGKRDYAKVNNWSQMTKEQREAVLTALGAYYA